MQTLIKYGIMLILVTSCQGQKKNASSDNLKLSQTNLKKHVTKLASDEFEGRGAGYEGEKKAAHYIADGFKSAGLTPFKLSKSGNPYFQSFSFHSIGSSNPWEKLETQNVIGLLKGSEKPNEYIIIGGHHDGQGMEGQADFGRNIGSITTDSIAATKDDIWNSAIDNAVSIATLIEVARVLIENNIKLTRSIIFTTFSAEESGLNGSIYLANNPPVERKKIKAMINLEQLVGDPDAEFLYVSFNTNPVFEEVQKKVDGISKINLAPFYPGIIPDTDHYSFVQRQIPSITMGTGSQINVHSSLDHSDGLDYELLTERAQYILSYLIELVNSESNFRFSGDLSWLIGVTGGDATDEEKAQFNLGGDVFKVTGVVKDSKGHEAGLVPGDLVVLIDGSPIEFTEFYKGLEDFMEDEDKSSFELTILRNGEEKKLNVSVE